MTQFVQWPSLNGIEFRKELRSASGSFVNPGEAIAVAELAERLPPDGFTKIETKSNQYRPEIKGFSL